MPEMGRDKGAWMVRGWSTGELTRGHEREDKGAKGETRSQRDKWERGKYKVLKGKKGQGQRGDKRVGCRGLGFRGKGGWLSCSGVRVQT
jgi:hypothetical protein